MHIVSTEAALIEDPEVDEAATDMADEAQKDWRNENVPIIEAEHDELELYKQIDDRRGHRRGDPAQRSNYPFGEAEQHHNTADMPAHGKDAAHDHNTAETAQSERERVPQCGVKRQQHAKVESNQFSFSIRAFSNSWRPAASVNND